ncbi:hypothetical protein [Limnoglobus roseus]|uniref:Uncharacterized protein n=1 Tax=Limnoglobus roseus TaxID=2598579 RepID=A0A5C1A993_9BACT|nr:hypothetical protein [Limnoglobus roseus]QEL14797.1 hypothetical protein PX52LOC_01691 [Limnoglobus roseus]
MATGDQADFISRIKAVLPGGWFRGATPVLDAVLAGIGAALSGVYSLAAYARLQTRIATATEGFLDLISFDYFGQSLPRKVQEPDTSFRARIIAALFPEKATRRGLIRALESLTGRTPVVFEPRRPADTGGYGIGGVGYGVGGGYGALNLPYQAFVTAFRPAGQGIPYVSGYGSTVGGYTTPSRLTYASLSQVQGSVTDKDIFAAVDAVMPAGTLAWTQIQS